MVGNFLRYASAIAFLGLSALSAARAQEGAARAQEGPALDFSGFDRSVAPADDFFQFVNGKWIAATEIPADKGRWGSFIILREEAAKHVREIVEQIGQAESLAEGSDQQKIRDLYRSFMDQERINQLGIAPIREDLQRIDAVSSGTELAQLLGRLARESVSHPLGLFVSQDAKQPDRYVVSVSQSGLGMPDRDYYFDEGPQAEALRAGYVTYVTRLLELAGDTDAPAKAAVIMDLEKKIAQHHWTLVENRDRNKTYNKVTRDELLATIPQFDWLTYLSIIGVADQESFVVRQPSYLTGLAQVAESTDLETWKAYLRLRVIEDAASYLSQPFFDASFDYYGRLLSGLEEPEPRWKRGVQLLDGAIGELIGKEYVARHFPAEAKQRMEKLVGNLIVAMRESIADLEWMTPATRQEALAKLARFNTKIGYPDQWKDYSKLAVSPDDLIGNLKRVTEVEHQRDIDKLGGPVDRHEWFMNPQTVNAYYNPLLNEIVFPAAILQPPFFYLHADDAVNYGAIGAVIGHEIGHGFDDQGRKSDGTGLLRDWWTKADANEYDKRAEKLVAQYDGFRPLPDTAVNGQLTLGENIGDLGGITIAYRAYQRALADQPVVPEQEGYRGDQRFFLSFAQLWRMKSREDMLRQQLKTDPHSPPQYRVNGVLRNFPPFYAAFGVNPGNGMYLPPAERVSIW